MRLTRTARMALFMAAALAPLTVYTPTTAFAPAHGTPLVDTGLRVAVAATIRRNLHPRLPVIYPSPAYYNPYLRDSFWAAQAMGRRRFAVRVLGFFAAAVNRSGDPPTMFVRAYAGPAYHDDESAALLLIWSWRNRQLYGVTPPRATLSRVLRYLLRRSRHGYEMTPAGPFGSWWDAYSLPGPSVLSYIQGLYAVALRCAQHLGLAVPPGASAAAERAYRSLFDPRLGYLPLSTRFPASDASALTGEFLSLWLFHHPMLTDRIVLSTLQHLTRFGAGFRVMALPPEHAYGDSGYLPTGLQGPPGDYQNGASWLLYDALTIGAAGLHGLPGALGLLRARLAMEFRSGPVLHEYLETNPTLLYYDSEPAIRDDFSWDTFVPIVERALQAFDAGPGRAHPSNRAAWHGNARVAGRRLRSQ